MEELKKAEKLDMEMKVQWWRVMLITAVFFLINSTVTAASFYYFGVAYEAVWVFGIGLANALINPLARVSNIDSFSRYEDLRDKARRKSYLWSLLLGGLVWLIPMAVCMDFWLGIAWPWNLIITVGIILGWMWVKYTVIKQAVYHESLRLGQPRELTLEDLFDWKDKE